MWCDRILGNIATPPGAPQLAGRRIDPVDVQWTQCQRVLDAKTRGGTAIRVLLPPGHRLKHGDVLFDDGSVAICVNVLPCEVVVARPCGSRLMSLLALELGNLHWPAEIGEAEIIFPEDGPALEVLEKLAIEFTRETRRFAPFATLVTTRVILSPSFGISFRRPGKTGVGD